MLPLYHLFPKKGSSERKLTFRVKVYFSKKVCYKVSLCENFQRQSCEAFTGLSNRAQMVCGGSHSAWKFGPNWPSKMPTSNRYSLDIASHPLHLAKKSTTNDYHYNRKFTTPFPMSLIKTAFLSPQRGLESRKRKSDLFPNKTAYFSKKVCYKLSLSENFQRQPRRAHSLAYLTVYKWLVGNALFYMKFRYKVTTHATLNRYSLE